VRLPPELTGVRSKPSKIKIKRDAELANRIARPSSAMGAHLNRMRIESKEFVRFDDSVASVDDSFASVDDSLVVDSFTSVDDSVMVA
jgi:hypothetical protein